jgi:energy-coupling factor transporter ATP-binding protein EcfA2
VVELDDPLQNLDDVDLLGLVDLLRRITPHRQLVVTTHDRHFGALLARKLRPLDESRRVSVVDILGWDRSGPTFEVAQVEPDPVPMKLARAVA